MEVYRRIFEEGVTDASISIACGYATRKLERRIEHNAHRANIIIVRNYSARKLDSSFSNMKDAMKRLSEAATLFGNSFIGIQYPMPSYYRLSTTLWRRLLNRIVPKKRKRLIELQDFVRTMNPLDVSPTFEDSPFLGHHSGIPLYEGGHAPEPIRKIVGTWEV